MTRKILQTRCRRASSHHKCAGHPSGCILMDALRIYDEKMRDGTLSEVFFSSSEGSEEEVSTTGVSDLAITADILGLDAIDTLKKDIPSVFTGLKDHDPSEEHRRVILEELPGIPLADQDRICSVLTAFSRQLTS